MRAVLITGACINTGVAIVERFAEEGKNVIFTGRKPESVREAEERYRKVFPDVAISGYAIDSLSDARTVDEASAEQMFKDLDEKGIFIECLVLNAADQGLGIKVMENPLTDFMKVLNTNVTWNYFLCELAAKRMKEQGGGNIVFINSNTAYRAIPDRVAYSTSKGAQLGMMRALALDLGKYNIRVNAVLPGMIKTDRWENNYNDCRNALSNYTPIGDIADFGDIANAVFYFGSDDSKNTTGAELVVDGGNMIQLYPIIPEKVKK
ncbi:MAG: SDR family oxidoreductase [Clostridia bacterium]|nr:SDR family oxidoreductase [Clostridia bacterium]